MLRSRTMALMVAALMMALSVTEALPRCRVLSSMPNINENLLVTTDTVFYSNIEYFCSKHAPEQYRCKCDLVSACHSFDGPWGTSLGQCGCCPLWMYMVFVFLILLGVITLCVLSYPRFCQGRWWVDGYPTTRRNVVSRKGVSVDCPIDVDLPRGLFVGFNHRDFETVPEGDEATEGRRDERRVSRQRRGGPLPSQPPQPPTQAPIAETVESSLSFHSSGEGTMDRTNPLDVVSTPRGATPNLGLRLPSPPPMAAHHPFPMSGQPEIGRGSLRFYPISSPPPVVGSPRGTPSPLRSPSTTPGGQTRSGGLPLPMGSPRGPTTALSPLGLNCTGTEQMRLSGSSNAIRGCISPP